MMRLYQPLDMQIGEEYFQRHQNIPQSWNLPTHVRCISIPNRAKRIQNKAVVNESPTDKLIRELKSENAKLMAELKRLQGLGSNNTIEGDHSMNGSSPRFTEFMSHRTIAQGCHTSDSLVLYIVTDQITDLI